MNIQLREATRALAEGDLSTHWLVTVALNNYTRDHSRRLFYFVAGTFEEADDYYTQLSNEDPEALRWEAAEVLARGGWTRSHVCNIFS